MAKSIEAELQEALGVKRQGRGQSRQEYFVTLLDAALKLEDDVWEALSGKAQKWVNEGRTNLNEDKEVEDFPDQEAEEETNVAEKEAEKEPEEKTPSKKKASEKTEKKAAAKSKPEKKEKEKKPVKEKAAREPSMRRLVRMAVVKKPKISVDDLIAMLTDKGIKAPSKVTVSAMRASTRDVLKCCVDAGKLEIEL
jgi:outer membrane biosynthesis protein TonB